MITKRRAFPAPDPVTAMREVFRELRIPQHEWNDERLDLQNSPARIVRMLRDELLASYRPGAYDELVRKFTCFPSDGQDAMVLLGSTSFSSVCSHHLLPFTGVAHIGYLPGPLVIGASKGARVIEYFSRMLQIQERMTRQIVDFIQEHAKARLVICLVKAEHQCMRCRGVKQAGSVMVTTAIAPQPKAVEDSAALRGVIDEFYQQLSLLR